LKVVFVVGTALIDGNFVVNNIGGSQPTGSFAEFAKRVPANVQAAAFTPLVVVGLAVAGRAAKAVVLTGGDGFVQRAEAFGGQFGTTGIVSGVR